MGCWLLLPKVSIRQYYHYHNFHNNVIIVNTVTTVPSATAIKNISTVTTAANLTTDLQNVTSVASSACKILEFGRMVFIFCCFYIIVLGKLGVMRLKQEKRDLIKIYIVAK